LRDSFGIYHSSAYRLLRLFRPLTALPERGLAMKKNEFSELGSNMLIVGSVTLAFMPFLLGDRLFMIVSGLITEGGLMIDQVGNYLSWLVS